MKNEYFVTNKFVETIEDANSDKGKKDKGRKLAPKKSSFNLDDGKYKATITNAFWYKSEDGRDRVMMVYEIEDGIEFKNSVDGDWIDEYPFSRLISQADIEYVEGFIGLKVEIVIQNKEGDYGVTFSNVKKITLTE